MEEFYNKNVSERDDNYEFFSGRNYLVSQEIFNLLEINKNDILVDLGAGSCINSKIILFAQKFEIWKQNKDEKEVLSELEKLKNFRFDLLSGEIKNQNVDLKILCVEPAKELLDEGLKNSSKELEPMCADAFEFSKKKFKFNKMLMKEMIHHIDIKDFKETFSNFYENKKNNINSKILIVTRPVKSPFPLFKLAEEIWEKNQLSYEKYIEEIEKSGFIDKNIKVTKKNYDIQMKKESYFKRVENKFISTFHLMTEEEFQNGLIELKEKYKNDEFINFTDVLIFIELII